MTLTLVPIYAPAFEAAGDKVSPDGAWTYTHEQDHDGVQVAATHLATGLARTFTTLTDAEAWTGGGTAALADLAGDAFNEIEGITFAEAKAEARAALVTLGVLLPAGSEAEHLCHCGGYLALGPGRVLRHVNTCVDEVEGGECEDVDGHSICRQPEAVQCEHHHCHTPNRVYALPCERGYDACCGCCNGEG